MKEDSQIDLKPNVRRIEMAGKIFGRLTVIKTSHRVGSRLFWKCKCSCGNEVSVVGRRLRQGITKSCGCLHSEIITVMNTTHGKSSSNTYAVWNSMIHRCHDERAISYKNYGAKGIAVCDEWRVFENFLRDMGERPAGGTIDRIDNSLGYSKNNCRWASQLEQARNKKNVRLVSAYGLTMTMPEWSEISGVKKSTLYKRIVLRGLEAEDAIPKIKKDGTSWTKQDEIDSKARAQLVINN